MQRKYEAYSANYYADGVDGAGVDGTMVQFVNGIPVFRAAAPNRISFDEAWRNWLTLAGILKDDSVEGCVRNRVGACQV